jgi:hypothetical protein
MRELVFAKLFTIFLNFVKNCFKNMSISSTLMAYYFLSLSGQTLERSYTRILFRGKSKAKP